MAPTRIQQLTMAMETAGMPGSIRPCRRGGHRPSPPVSQTSDLVLLLWIAGSFRPLTYVSNHGGDQGLRQALSLYAHLRVNGAVFVSAWAIFEGAIETPSALANPEGVSRIINGDTPLWLRFRRQEYIIGLGIPFHSRSYRFGSLYKDDQSSHRQLHSSSPLPFPSTIRKRCLSDMFYSSS
jgi:hypothetical protein